MIVLALDTSTIVPVIAVSGRGGPHFAANIGEGEATRQGRQIVPMIRDVLRESGGRVPDLVAVGLGPGSFTGLRVGLMAAKSLAYAWTRPLVGFESLAAIAAGALWLDHATVVLDAQRGGLFMASFRRETEDGPTFETGGVELVDVATWASVVPAGSRVLTPDPDRLHNLTNGCLAGLIVQRAVPTAQAIIDLGVAAWERGELLNPFLVEPKYGRLSAAEEKRESSS